MRLTATSKFGAGRPPVLSMSDLQSVCEMLRCINADVGPILKLVSFLGAGQVGGGAYAGHTEMVDLDGIFRAIYKEASLQTGLNETLFGGGKGFDLITTTMSSLGEAIERLIAALVSSSPHLPADRKVGSYDEMVGSGYPVISPAAIGLFSEDQYKQPNFLYRPFMTNLPIQWIEARRVCSGDKVWIPAQLVDMVHVYDPAESIVGYPVSGGLSCHRSYAEALYHGITEVVERDAINVSWYTDARPYVVDLEGLSDRHLLGFFESVEVNCSRTALLYHPSSVTNAATFSLISLNDWQKRRGYCAGGGCDYDVISALHKTATEYGQSRGTMVISTTNPRSALGWTVARMFDWSPNQPLAEMKLFFQAIGFYGLPEYRNELNHYFESPHISLTEILDTVGESATDIPTRLDQLLLDLQTRGIDPIVLDYSHPDWKRLTILKIWIPEITSPFLQSRPMLGHPRLAKLRTTLRQPGGWLMPLPYP